MGVLVGCAYALRTPGRLFTGPVSPRMREVAELRGFELAAAGLLNLGVATSPALKVINASVANLSAAKLPRSAQEK